MKRSLLLLSFLAAGCSTGGALDPTAASAPTPSAAAGKYLDLTAGTGDCVGTADDKLAVVELPNGPAFTDLLPKAGRTPELDGVDGPLRVVVYVAGWPGPTTGLPGRQPETPDPGTWDVCVQRIDGESIEGLPFIVYGSISQEGTTLVTP